MTVRDTLVFRGRRWLAVETVGRLFPNERHFSFQVSGNGQRWSTERPLAFWRNFAALNLNDVNDAMIFLTRHGDPFGHLDGEPYDRDKGLFLPRGHTFSAKWSALQDELKRIAAAWDEPDSNGVYLISRDPQRLGAAQDALYELAPPDKTGLPDFEWIAQGRGLVPRARTLRAFMIASAASALQRGIKMRVCACCHEFFELRRSDALYCSGSCQAAHYKQKAMASHKRKGRPSHGKRA
jgi:hypothetical protein